MEEGRLECVEKQDRLKWVEQPDRLTGPSRLGTLGNLADCLAPSTLWCQAITGGSKGKRHPNSG